MSQPRHWFPFMLRDELDMLECQLYEHYETIHRFIVVEATLTHQGNPKRLWYDENKSRFAQYADKIIHMVVDWLPTDQQFGATSEKTRYRANWFREQTQRDAAMHAFMHMTDPNDIVIVSDVDEIPSRAALAAQPNPCLGGNLYLRFAAVDWPGTPGVNMVLARAGAVVSIDRLRQIREQLPVMDPAGWHFSWFGGQEAIAEKIGCFCHLEAYASTKALNDVNAMYGYGLGELPPDGILRPAQSLEIPEVSTFEERDVLPWEQQSPLWVHKRLCPDSWWRPHLEETRI